jgi:DNA polymerase III delta prime subunit
MNNSFIAVKSRIKQSQLSNSKELDLAGMGLDHIPPELEEMNRLTILDLSDNNLKELPDFIGSFASLEYLDLSRNKLRLLPQSFKELISLETLNLSNNRLLSLPDDVRNLPSLKTLNIAGNEVAGDSGPCENLSTTTTLLDHIEKIIELSKKNGLTKMFFKIADVHIRYVADTLGINSIPAILFSHFVDNAEDRSIRISQIAKSLDCSSVRILQYMNEIEELEQKKLVICCRDPEVSYRIPIDVLNALRKNQAYIPPNRSNISIEDLFTVLGDLLKQREDRELTSESLYEELNALLAENMQLSFSKKIRNCNLDDESLLLLLCFCYLFVENEDDEIRFHDFNDYFEEGHIFNSIKKMLLRGEHVLMEIKYIEYANTGDFSERNVFKLSDKAKKDLLEELAVNTLGKHNKKGLLLSSSFTEKSMFYNKKEEDHIHQLSNLLEKDNFKTVQERLDSSGMRNGFACLFYGPPGTGKTETVYQIARKTGRDVMMVNISETKSHWFGDSEKKIKEIFDRYNSYVESNELAPILLFNEADAVIGTRKEIGGTNSAVDQTENAMQNIILQEMENLKGIMIATTNLTKNMDKAFERRFLYKIEFAKPNQEAKKSIWQSLMPDLPQEEIDSLACEYDFSGGQIENISRKFTVDRVLFGRTSFEKLNGHCQDEMLNKAAATAIGFKAS